MLGVVVAVQFLQIPDFCHDSCSMGSRTVLLQEDSISVWGVDTGGIRGSEPPPDINNKSLIKIKFLSILVDV